MEYHDQPLQFVSTHFIQAKDRNAGEYLSITTLIASFATFPLLGMPIVAYVTCHYIYIKVGLFMEKYAEYLSIDESPRNSINVLYYIFPGSGCFIITFFLFILHLASGIQFVKYDKEILHDDDLHLPYLHVACSWVAIIGLFTTCIVTAIYFCKTKKEDTNTANVANHLTASVVSLNVIYLACYFSPFMLLAFIRDPLITTLTYCTIVLFIVILIWSNIMLLKYLTIRNVLESTWVDKAILILTGIGLFISVIGSFAILVIFVSSATTLGSFNDFQSLQTLFLSLLVGLVSFSIAKPIYEWACKVSNSKKNDTK